MKQKLVYIAIILLMIGILISQVKFIPSRENNQAILIISVFFLSAIIGIVYLIKRWIYNYKHKHSLNRIQWIKSTIVSILFISGVPFLLFLSIFSVGQGIFGPYLINEKILGGDKIYWYHKECFIPDNICECDDYYSLVYIKNKHLPIMHLVVKVDFYIADIQLNKGELILYSSETCPRDRNKVKKVKLK